MEREMKTTVKIVSPELFQAAEIGTVVLEFTVGDEEIATGGGWLIFTPITTMPHVWSMVRWKIGGTVAKCAECADLESYVIRPDRKTYSESCAQLVRIINHDEPIKPGAKVFLELADTVVQSFAMKGSWFGFEEDCKGTGAEAYSAPIDGYDGTRLAEGVKRLDNLYFDVRPAEAERLVAVLSGKPDDKGGIRLHVRAEDRFGNAVPVPDDTITIETVTGPAEFPARVNISLDEPVCIEGRMAGEGTSWLWVHCPNAWLETLSNCVSTRLPDNVYFGDLHGHSALSDGLGSGEDYFIHARDVSFLDFVSLTDHNRFDDEIIELSEGFNHAGRFVTIFGRERGGVEGHRNLYALDSEDVRAVGEGDLWDVISGRSVLVVPHHTNCSTCNHWSYASFERYDPETERLIEVVQNRGSFEVDEVGGPVLDGGYGVSVQDALALGRRFGFIGGSDTHRGHPGGPSHPLGPIYNRWKPITGISAVYANDLSRGSLFKGLWSRFTYVTTGPRILMDFSVNGSRMGSEIDVCDSAAITGFVAGATELDMVEIVRDNEVLYHIDGDGQRVIEIDYVDNKPGKFYYLRVRQIDGHYGYASPVWVGKNKD